MDNEKQAKFVSPTHSEIELRAYYLWLNDLQNHLFIYSPEAYWWEAERLAYKDAYLAIGEE